MKKIKTRGVFRAPRAPFVYNHLFFLWSFEELQTVLIEVKLNINNARLTYDYPNTIKTYLTPNHFCLADSYYTDFTIWKRGRQYRCRYMKICTLRMRKIKKNPSAKFCCTGRTWSCDVLMKTCNILFKIMVILDIHGTKVLTIFTVEYHTTFFDFILKDWACIKCFACFLVCLLFFFASNQCRVRLEK